MAGTQSSALPFKTLAALTVAVLLGHAVVLQGTSLSLRASENKVTRPFSTRVIEIKAMPPAPNEPATANATPAPAKAPVKAPLKAPTLRPQKPAVLPDANARPDAGQTALTGQNSESNQALPPVQPAQSATNTEANEVADAAAVIGPAPVPTPAASSAQAGAPAAAESSSAATSPAPAAAQPSRTQTATTAYTVPGSVRLKYDVAGTRDRLNYTARAELLWLQDGNTYEARQEVGAFLIGKRVFTSTGRMTADGLAPLRYSDKARNELAAHFDRDRQRVTFSANTPESPLQPGAQDRVSVFVQLASLLAGAPEKYPAGTAINVQIIGPRATEVWAIAVDGEEKLNLPGGALAAIKLTRAARGEFDLKTEFWLAPALGYLPARIRFTQANGDFVDMAWRATEAP